MNISLSVTLITLLLSNLYFNSFSARNGKYNACSQRIQCGHLSDISYPFYDDETRPEYCGYPGFKLDCLHGGPQIKISALYYYVLSIHESNAIVAQIDIWATNCPSTLINADIDHSLYEFTSLDRNITFFYDCIHSISKIPVSCQTIQGSYYMTNKMQSENSLNLSEVCAGNLLLPILKSSEDTIDMSVIDHGPVDLEGVFRQGFELRMIADFELCSECVESGGQCGYNSSSDKFVCYCTDDNSDIKCELNSSRGTILLS